MTNQPDGAGRLLNDEAAPAIGIESGAGALAVALADEERIYTSMLALAAREEIAIVGGDVEELTTIVDEKEQLIEHLHALETERMTAIVAIATACGDDPETMTLSEVAALLPAELSVSLTETGVLLRAQAIALQQANGRNADLLRRSHELIDRWVNYMKQLLSGSLYGEDGRTGELPGGRSLDRTA